MKLAIVGSREFNDYIKFKNVIIEYFDVPKITKIISGGARGVDTLAERFADENDISTLIFKPDWNKHGKSAGFIRNKDIVKSADVVIAVWNGISKGTKHSINICNENNKPLYIYNYVEETITLYNQ